MPAEGVVDDAGPAPIVPASGSAERILHERDWRCGHEADLAGLPCSGAAAMIRNALSIAGSDPSGGAGIQADLKAFSALGVYGMAAITALTAQNTRGVSGVHLVPPDFVHMQIADVLADIKVDAVKIGMIATSGIARAVAEALRPHALPIVLDPVMVAKGGASLLADDAVDALRTHLLPLATILTPNLPEAAQLLSRPAATTRDGMAEQALQLAGLGPHAVLLKGGHLGGKASPDCLAIGRDIVWLEGVRIATASTHGTGCTLSSAIAAGLSKQHGIAEAVEEAKAYVAGAIRNAHLLSVGHGHGPTHHFHGLWNR
jgi:hydroxymethylpyrimidine/phosphomethylpyrimidine kinase